MRTGNKVSKPSRFINVINSFWFYFFLSWIPAVFWMLGQYPGLFIVDIFYALDNAENGIFSHWHSWPYGVLIWFFSRFSYDLVGLLIFQCFVFISIAALIFSLPKKMKLYPLWPIALFQAFLVIPIVGAFFVFHTRDVWFNWLLMLLFYFFFLFKMDQKKKRPFYWGYNFSLVSLSSLLLAFRLDFLPVALALPFLIYGVDKSKLTIKRWLVFFSFHLITILVIPHLLSVAPLGPLYQLTTVLNPLSYIVRKAPEGDIEKWDASLKENIEKVVTFETLKSVYDEYEIPVFHQAKFNSEMTEEDFQKLRQSYFELVKKYPGLFFENRVVLVLEMLRLHGESNHWYDDLFFYGHYPSSEQMTLIRKFELRKKPVCPYFQFIQNQGSSDLRAGKLGYGTKVLLTSALPGLILALLGLLGFFRLPVYFWISSLLLSRAFIVFLMAPAAQFKYIYSLYLFMFFAPIFIWVEWKQNKALKKTTFQEPF